MMSDPGSAPAAAQPNAATLTGGRGTRRRWVIAVAAAALWLAMLAGLALFTANPVTLNIEQIRASDYVIRGRLLEGGDAVIAAERNWKGGDLPSEVRAGNLPKKALRPGRPYLVPLSRTRSGLLEVTRTDLPGNPPLVYPATEEAIAQLSAILSGASADQSGSKSGSDPER